MEVGNTEENAQFRALVAEACDSLNKITCGRSNAMVTGSSGGANRLKLVVCPMDVPFLSARGSEAQAMVFVSEEPPSPEDSLDRLAKRYRLTHAEIELVQVLCAGHSLAEAAAERRLAVETVRSQLKSVFAKTETHRQAELVRLVLGLCGDGW